MNELNDFYNAGFGWICRHCERERRASESEENAAGATRSRLLSEGEAESKTPTLSTTALARWADPAHRRLICPRCGITETVDKF